MTTLLFNERVTKGEIIQSCIEISIIIIVIVAVVVCNNKLKKNKE